MANVNSNLYTPPLAQGQTGASVLPSFTPSFGPNAPKTNPSNADIAGLLMGPLGSSTAPAAPSQPIASQVHTDASGNSIKTTYAPTNPTASTGGIINNNTQSNSQNGSQTNSPGTFTTPSGAVVDANGNLIKAPQTNPFAGLIGGITNVAGQNAAIGQNAANIAADYAKQIADVQKQSAGLENAYKTAPGMAFPTSQGLAQNAAATAGQLTQGLSAAENAALAGTRQQLTAAGQQAGALGTAARLIQPSSAGFPFTYDPATNSFAVSGGNLQGAISGGVQQAISNPALYTALNSAITSTYGNAAAGMFQQAFINAGGNPNVAAGQAQGAQAIAAAPGLGAAAGTQAVLAAPGQATAANIGTTGTAAISAANTAYNTAVQKVASNTATYSALTGVSSNLNDTLASWGNNGLLTNYNQAINKIGSLTSNPEYTKFVTALGNAQASYQAALGSSGVTPSKADQDALAALNPNSSATAINAALNQLSTDAHALLIVPAYQQQQTYAQQLGIK
jgi:hypothetical protein